MNKIDFEILVIKHCECFKRFRALIDFFKEHQTRIVELHFENIILDDKSLEQLLKNVHEVDTLRKLRLIQMAGVQKHLSDIK